MGCPVSGMLAGIRVPGRRIATAPRDVGGLPCWPRATKVSGIIWSTPGNGCRRYRAVWPCCVAGLAKLGPPGSRALVHGIRTRRKQRHEPREGRTGYEDAWPGARPFWGSGYWTAGFPRTWVDGQLNGNCQQALEKPEPRSAGAAGLTPGRLVEFKGLPGPAGRSGRNEPRVRRRP